MCITILGAEFRFVKATIEVQAVAQRQLIKLSIGIALPEEGPLVFTWSPWQRWYYPEELLALLDPAGFISVELLSDFTSLPV